MPEPSEHRGEVAGQPVFWRSAPATRTDAAPVLYLHGVPTSSDDWLSLLERTGGLAPDLPGFGRSGKRGDGDYTAPGIAAFVEAYLDMLGVDRVRLVVHDWGAAGLIWAQRAPERVERLVICDAVPLLAGYRWHRLARVWRARGAGEVAIGAMTRAALRQALPRPVADAAWPHFDQGTQRAILRLYRSSPEAALAEAGSELGALHCPALVVWGERDPYIPASFAQAYAGALGGDARVEVVAGAGHWPWWDRPEVAGLVAGFLDG